MAREEKRIELKPVAESPDDSDSPVLRLESDDTLQRGKSGRPDVQPDDLVVTRRLVLPSRGDIDTRTHQPGIDALMEGPANTLAPLEGGWGTGSTQGKRLPWGWFVVMAVIPVGAVVWSLTHVNQSDVQAHEIRETTKSVLTSEADEEKEASALIDQLEAAKLAFYKASSVDELARTVRQPERVRPLMEDYYSKHPLTPHTISRTRTLTPQTIANRANFWTTSVELEDKTNRSVVLEILDSGEAKVDWETSICYQPLDWTAYALERPAGKSYDFRVYVEQDNLFSHEFADSSQWNSFRLTALDSIETLFGYARTTSPVSRDILEQLKYNKGGRTPMILRVTIPEGLQSRRGVVIEKLMNPRWLYLDPPDSGS